MSLKCPFSTLQAAGLCGCRQAQQVVRRGGSEYDCENRAAHSLCSGLADGLISIGFAELGYEDDLAATPKSVYDKVWMGGLQGLAELAPVALDDAQALADIWGLVECSSAQLQPLDRHKSRLLHAIREYRPPKRRRRRD